VILPSDKPPTIIDVAERAHVSKSTVSNVLQAKPHVSEQTRDRVLAAIAELGYRTNVAARHLRQRSRVLGVVAGDLHNPFHAEVAALIEQRASAEGHTMLLATTNGLPTEEQARVQALIEHRVAAVIFLAFSGSTEVLTMIPDDVCLLFVSSRARGGISITVDDNQGPKLAVEHLLSLGHRRIAYVSTTLGHEPQVDEARYAGYARTLREHGIDAGALPALRLRDVKSSPEIVRTRLVELLSAAPRPSAVFASSDFGAIEVMEAADAAGLSIPENLSVVGFDDISVAALSRIALTTVAQPIAALADHAVRCAIAPPTARRRRDVVLAPQLVVRGSTAALRRGLAEG
jgi:LacI family transcriptional regulator